MIIHNLILSTKIKFLKVLLNLFNLKLNFVIVSNFHLFVLITNEKIHSTIPITRIITPIENSIFKLNNPFYIQLEDFASLVSEIIKVSNF